MNYDPIIETARARILLAEDNPEMREVFHRCLGESYLVISVENGDELEREIIEGEYDIIISDIVMDGKNCQAIYREHIQNRKRVPFIMVSGHIPQGPGTQPRVLGNQADQLYLLAKPFKLQTLLDLVEHALSSS